MSVTGATRVYAVLGDAVRRSLSPVMHNGWFADQGLDAVFVSLPLTGDDAVAAIRALKQFGLKGANVTAPHKEAAARAADRCDHPAANVLRWEEDGAVSGFNTDGAGFLDALDEAAPDWRERVRRVLMLGAGGAALGIAAALAPHVDAVQFANRTPARADAASRTVANGRTLGWADLERGFATADLIVQATTLGEGGISWPVAQASPSAIIADIVYRPLETDLLRAARARNLATMDGLGMLIHQGARSFELWTGVKPDVAKARARLIVAIGS